MFRKLLRTTLSPLLLTAIFRAQGVTSLLNAQEQGIVRLTNDGNIDQFPTWSPDGKSIVFVSYPGGQNPDLWEVSPSATNLQQLTTGVHGSYGGGIQDPAWLGTSGDLVVQDTVFFWEWDRFTLSANPPLPVDHSVANGSQPDFDQLLFVPGGLGGQWLAVSPDGTTAAWDALTSPAGQCPSHTDLHIGSINSMTGQDNNAYGQIVASFSLNCSVGNMDAVIGLSFSPDGSQIVAGTLSDANYYAFDLSIYNRDGTLVRQLTTSGAGPNHTVNWRPVWSSDNRIAFASNSTGRFEVWAINPDGSSLTQVTTNGGDMPTWSPDASKVAFISSRDGTPQLYSLLVGGTAPVIPQQSVPPAGNGAANGPTNHEVTGGEPVSTGSGNYHYEHADFNVTARGMPLTFERYYNSIDSFSGPLGTNWNHGYNVLLGQTSTGVATIRWGDGHGETYTLTGGVYLPQAGVYNSLVANPDTTFTLTLKSQTQYLFSSAGKLVQIQDKNGNGVQLTYDGSGNLMTIAAAGGRSLTLAYDSSGRIVSVTDPIGHVELYSYDAANDLVSATDPLGGVTRYGYDGSHHVAQITLPSGNILLQNSYDSQGRTISQTNGRSFTWQFAYNTPTSGQTTITDARGPITVHTYDNALRIVSILDALGHTTSYTYDANSDRTSITNQSGNMTNFAYDANGNLTRLADPLSNVTAFTYDSENNLLTVTNPKEKTTNFSYDAHGNLTAIQDALGNKTAFVYDSIGELISKTNARSNTTKFQYTSSGDLATITDALANSTNLGYDGDGRLVSLTDPSLHAATSSYDALGRLTQVSDALGDKTQFSYDAVGNPLSVTDANGHATGYSYDATNNLVSVTDALGHVTKYAYDADNNRIRFTNAKGNSTSYQFDALNRLTRSVDPLGFATAYSYDAVGNVATVTDAKGQTNEFAYDALNHLLSIAYADQKNVAYAYDADGNRTSMIDWTGTTSYF
jgi:YD repeat-containing protein